MDGYQFPIPNPLNAQGDEFFGILAFSEDIHRVCHHNRHLIGVLIRHTQFFGPRL